MAIEEQSKWRSRGDFKPRLLMKRFLVRMNVLHHHREATILHYFLMRRDRTARDRQAQPFCAGHRVQTTTEVGERTLPGEGIHQIWMWHGGQKLTTLSQETSTLLQGILKATGGQFIEEHAGQDQMERAIWEGKCILHIQGGVFRSINMEGGL